MKGELWQGWTIYHLPGLDPIPWKAPDASVGRAKGGGTFVRFHSDPSMVGFQEAVKEEMELHNPNIFMFPTGVPVDLRFWFWRNTQGHNIADATNCQKALEDALQGILFVNDRQVKSIKTTWVEQHDRAEPYIIIGIRYAEVTIIHHPPRRTFAPPPDSITGTHLEGEDIGF